MNRILLASPVLLTVLGCRPESNVVIHAPVPVRVADVPQLRQHNVSVIGGFACGNHKPAHFAGSTSEIDELTRQHGCSSWYFMGVASSDAQALATFAPNYSRISPHEVTNRVARLSAMVPDDSCPADGHITVYAPAPVPVADLAFSSNTKMVSVGGFSCGNHQPSHFASNGNDMQKLTQVHGCTEWRFMGVASSDPKTIETASPKYAGIGPEDMAKYFTAYGPEAANYDRNCTSINGTIGNSSQLGSGWIDLNTPLDFEAGTTLRVRVGGTARRILVRLLPKGEDPGHPQEILGVFEVPDSRVVRVPIAARHTAIVQVSVHGSPNAWSWSLGASNNGASMGEASICR